MVYRFCLNSYLLFIRVITYYIPFFLLDEEERNGTLKSYTRLKFLRKGNIIVSFTNGRTIRGIAWSSALNDPFAKALYQKYKLGTANNGSSMCDYLNDKNQQISKKTIGDFHKDIMFGEYTNFPIWSFSYPWEHFSMRSKKENYKDMVMENRIEYVDTNISEVDLFGRSHEVQFDLLMNSIVNNGYNSRIKDRVGIVILIKGKEWRWIMSGQGNHRAYICNYLGLKNFPVHIDCVVHFDKLGSLKRAGAEGYTLKAKQLIFDKVFTAAGAILRGLE
jgi:hypothetical protein